MHSTNTYVSIFDFDAIIRPHITTNPSDYSGQPSQIVNDAKTQYFQSVPIAGQRLGFSIAPGEQHHDEPTNAASVDHFTQPETIINLFSNERDNDRQYQNPFLTQPISFTATNLNAYKTDPNRSMFYGDNDLNYMDDVDENFDESNDLMADNIDNNYSEQIRCLNRVRQFFQTFHTK